MYKIRLKYSIFLLIGLIQSHCFAQVENVIVDTTLECNYKRNYEDLDIDTLEYGTLNYLIIYHDSLIRQVSLVSKYNYSSVMIRNFHYEADTLIYFSRQDGNNKKIENLSGSSEDIATFFTLLNQTELICSKVVKFNSISSVTFSLLDQSPSNPENRYYYSLYKGDIENWQIDFTLLKEAEGEFYRYFAHCLLHNIPIVLELNHFIEYFVRPGERVEQFNNEYKNNNDFEKDYPKEASILNNLLFEKKYQALSDSCLAMKLRFSNIFYLDKMHGIALRKMGNLSQLERIDHLLKANRFWEASLSCFNILCWDPEMNPAQFKLDEIKVLMKEKFPFEELDSINILLDKMDFKTSTYYCDSLYEKFPKNQHLRYLKAISNKLYHAQLMNQLGEHYFLKGKLWVSDAISEDYLRDFPKDSIALKRREQILTSWATLK